MESWQVDRARATIVRRVIQDPEKGCWLWQGARSPFGYGVMGIPGTSRTRSVHALAYEAFRSPPPKGLHLDHEACDRPQCCNPWHLVPKSAWENLARSKTNPFAVKARATECLNGHPLEGDNVYVHPQRGTRHCKECKRDRDQAYRYRTPEKEHHRGPRRGHGGRPRKVENR